MSWSSCWAVRCRSVAAAEAWMVSGRLDPGMGMTTGLCQFPGEGHLLGGGVQFVGDLGERLVALTRTAALELAECDITVNAIALDLAGPCEPDHIADAVVYLLSDAARGINGQVVRTDRPTVELRARCNGDEPRP